jgi:hypothetical protein
MLDAPWDKDQQQANQWQGSHREYIKSTPYATSDDRQACATFCFNLFSYLLSLNMQLPIQDGNCA